MTTDWHQFLDFAALLLENPVPAVAAEIQYRVSISRAYYAAFHAARDHLTDYYGYRWNHERGSHEQVISQFDRPAHLGYYKVAKDLERLRRLRVQADYHAAPQPQPHDAQRAVELAGRIIRAIARLP